MRLHPDVTRDVDLVRPWTTELAGFGYGGDYNPEQWPREVWAQDLSLMQAAGVNLVSVAIFAWATIEPESGRYEWEWLDDVLDGLHEAGVQVALATATASPPPWLTMAHPEILPRTAEGVVLHQGARQSYSVHHPTHREHALRLTRAIAERYGNHPALALWHVDNEIGCHVPRDYSPAAAEAFRSWLADRYGDIEELNQAWGTAFWSQRYASFDHVLPPLAAPTYANPTQQLDFHRFTSDALLDYFLDLRGVLRAVTPHVPITTNLMAHSTTWGMDYFTWAPHLDVVASDHYTSAADEERHVELAFSADLKRGLAGGQPWILMEHSTSAVNWQPRNRAKHPGELVRNSLSHLARGADSIMFFQWRASKAGAEKYHSAMVPHAGPDTDVHDAVGELGDLLQRIAEVQGSVVRARTAIVVDWQAWWAAELDSHPTQDFSYMAGVLAVYAPLWELGITTDIVHPGADLTGYDVVVIPGLHLVRDEHAAAITAVAERGGQVVVTWFSGIVDQHDHVRLGGYPGAFRELLGVRTQEFWPLQAGEEVEVAGAGIGGRSTAKLWTEQVDVVDADVVATLVDGPLTGGAAVTRRDLGAGGAAWYVAADLGRDALRSLLASVCEAAGVQAPVHAPPGVEVVRRHGADASWLVAINHTDEATVLAVAGHDLLNASDVEELVVAAGDVAVLRERRVP